MNLIMICALFYFGAVIGSFLNVVILRLPREEKLTGRSHCSSCGHVLSFWELFPLFSYVFLLGKCRSCKKPISSRYFIIEGITGLLFALAWFVFQPATLLQYLLLVKSLLVISVFVVVFVVDLEHFLILDNVIFPAAGLVMLLNYALDLLGGQGIFHWSGYLLPAVVGAVAAAAPFYVLWYLSKGQWMGFGDVKLALFLGAALGWPNVAINLMVAVFLGGCVSVGLLISRKKGLKSRVPFGTFLSLAGVLALFYGADLLRWYLSYLGF